MDRDNSPAHDPVSLEGGEHNVMDGWHCVPREHNDNVIPGVQNGWPSMHCAGVCEGRYRVMPVHSCYACRSRAPGRRGRGGRVVAAHKDNQ